MNAVRLLLVDDEELARRALRRLLKTIEDGLAYAVVEAASGGEALAVLSRETVDCMLLDVQMPGGSGVEWLPRLAAAQPRAAIVMVTGVRDEEVAVTAMKSGAMDYLVKGAMSPWSLKRAILNVMEKTALLGEIDRQREILLTVERYRAVAQNLTSLQHHLGQPMTVLRAGLALLQREELSVRARDIAGDCVAAAERMAAFIDRLRMRAAAPDGGADEGERT